MPGRCSRSCSPPRPSSSRSTASSSAPATRASSRGPWSPRSRSSRRWRSWRARSRGCGPRSTCSWSRGSPPPARASPDGAGRASALRRSALEGLDHALHDEHARVGLVLARHDRPRRALRVRLGEHVLDGDLVVGAPAAVAPVVLGQLPALERILLALAEALELLGIGDVHPELDEGHPLGGEHALEAVDLVVGAAPLLLGGVALDALDEHPPVPG